MKEEIKKLIEEVVIQTRAGAKELVEIGGIKVAADAISVLTATYLELEKKEGE